MFYTGPHGQKELNLEDSDSSVANMFQTTRFEGDQIWNLCLSLIPNSKSGEDNPYLDKDWCFIL